MARLLEVVPARLVALVVVPLLLGLGLFVAIVDLPPVAWAIVYLVVIGGVMVMALIVAHLYLLDQQEEVGEGDVGGQYRQE